MPSAAEVNVIASVENQLSQVANELTELTRALFNSASANEVVPSAAEEKAQDVQAQAAAGSQAPLVQSNEEKKSSDEFNYKHPLNLIKLLYSFIRNENEEILSQSFNNSLPVVTSALEELKYVYEHDIQILRMDHQVYLSLLKNRIREYETGMKNIIKKRYIYDIEKIKNRIMTLVCSNELEEAYIIDLGKLLDEKVEHIRQQNILASEQILNSSSPANEVEPSAQASAGSQASAVQQASNEVANEVVPLAHANEVVQNDDDILNEIFRILDS